MKAIILAAGRGSRMKDITNVKPKCLTVLAGKTLLDWQMAALRQAGVEDMIVVGGYRKELLPPENLTILDNPRWAETNMVRTLCCAREFLLHSPCLVAYSDIVYHPDIIETLSHTEDDIAIPYDRLWLQLWQERFVNPLADAETFKINGEGLIQEIGKRTTSGEKIEGQYMGLLKFSPSGWRYVEEILAALPQEQVDKLDMTSLLSRLLTQDRKIRGVAIDGRWCEVDNENDLQLYENKINSAKSETWSHDWRWE